MLRLPRRRLRRACAAWRQPRPPFPPPTPARGAASHRLRCCPFLPCRPRKKKKNVGPQSQPIRSARRRPHPAPVGQPGRLGGYRRLLGTAPAPVGDGAPRGSTSSPDAMQIMVGVLVTVIICTLLYCVYCRRWRKRNAIRRSLLWPRSVPFIRCPTNTAAMANMAMLILLYAKANLLMQMQLTSF